jgi:DNA replication protein DnaC
MGFTLQRMLEGMGVTTVIAAPGKMLRRSSDRVKMDRRDARTLQGFDFRFNDDALPASTLRDLVSVHFVEQGRNLVLAGPTGIGKTHSAKAIGHEMCRRGFEVVIRKTHSLLGELLDRTSPRHAERFLNRCLKVELLILDDFAFRALDHKEAEVLDSLADDRVGRASTILTSNRPPQDWYAIFPQSGDGKRNTGPHGFGSIEIDRDKGEVISQRGVF